MPTYQYACTACGHQLEAVQSFSDAPLNDCPECKGKLRKVFSAVGIVFKGSGFYRTDSRSNSKSASSSTSSSSSTSNGGESTKATTETTSSGSAASGSTASDKAPASTGTSAS